MVLPINLLSISKGTSLLVELKNGDAYNGRLLNVDNWMNLHLSDVVHTSSDGETFWKLPEVMIRGITIKYIRLEEKVIEKAKKENSKFHAAATSSSVTKPSRAFENGPKGGMFKKPQPTDKISNK